MNLNPDICYDIVQHFTLPGKWEKELTARFMLSGKEPFFALKRFLKKAEMISFASWGIRDEYYIATSPFIALVVMFDDRTERIYTNLRHPYMEQAVRWALSTVKKVKVALLDPLPADVTTRLLNNPNFKVLELFDCNVSTAKLLLKSRRFDHIRLSSFVFDKLDDICLETEELELNVPVEKILKLKSVKTNSLYVANTEENFPDNLLTVNVDPGFQSLKKLNLDVKKVKLFYNPEKLLQLLQFLSTKLVNLELLELKFTEDYDELDYNEEQRRFVMPPNFLQNLANYQNKLSVYNAPQNVCIHIQHSIGSIVNSMLDEAAAGDYFLEIAMELESQDFIIELDIDDENESFFHKNIITSENLQLNLTFCLEYRDDEYAD